MPLSDETKDRYNAVLGIAKVRLFLTAPLAASRSRAVHLTVFSVGWIPLIIYIGYRNSSPQPSLIKLITPLA
ncbi:hypothetical protein I307_05385 [Cryptococcus deuterogattii 99/473]|uniref:Unplaced genomic scaffold supercont1.7, whole genome shotgun sequence n=1 Tax=Cryptococcus deuterogattii Ram5 TaxID=1296110 RepID=A0A0D0V6R0_9TREE|nr:hypothetical protein I309_05410 [Cryptococcus deuterogattii LA55]KIR33866.1 hypothetical protein I352_03948 [Cryptococcus deuterogattii MMRL2647]KIR40585.1 hypothetical protein I313_03236 [Cryptococcus deuterogattii Ram5]KIR74266.1 hypothetical protein I310_01868 [Cryptococcus deuterogattii CA1014]KIR94248.1 hypothetical protein I304_01885 [Cryptococcus deuterogattii CBS 10090]KIS01255.1 hypothetical protein L804_01129 [Cryptococcus deuterogattii 2001/935-1]KIY55236.1 hypothetical protein 